MFFFFKQKTAYEMRISDWSSDVCSSDLADAAISSSGAKPRRRHPPIRITTGQRPGSAARRRFLCEEAEAGGTAAGHAGEQAVRPLTKLGESHLHGRR